VDVDAPAFLQYSSGTTGLKKGVTVSHRALLWQVETYADAIGAGPGDRIASWLPLYHDMGLIACFFLPLIRKVSVVAISPFDWVKRPSLWVEAVAKNRATLSWLPNFAYNHLAATVREEEIAGMSLDSLRGVVNCSEPIIATSHATFLERFSRHGFAPEALAASYALAENTFAATSGGFGRPLLHDDSLGRPLVSSGSPLPETDVRIVGDDGSELDERREGEVLLRSPSLMNGYDGNAEATAAALVDGWYRTGDLGYLADGELFVTGRKQDLIIVGGKNIYPQDVEAVVNEVGGVIPGRVVAFGVPREELGTESLVILAESDESNDPVLRREVHAAVAEHSDLVPGDVLLLPPRTLVKSTAGKISRSENRRRYLDEWSAPAVARVDGDPVRRAVLSVVGRDVDPATIDDDTPLVSSGLVDSFALAELLVAVESAADVTIPAGELDDASFETIAAIGELVERARVRGNGRGTDAARVDVPDVPLVYDQPRTWPARPKRPGLWTTYYKLLFRAKGVRHGDGLRVLGPIMLELLGPGRNLVIGDRVTLMPGVHLKLRENGRIVLHDGVKLDTATRLVAANDACIEVGAETTLGAGTIVNAGADVLVGRGTLTSAYCMINASDHLMAAGRPIREQGYEHEAIRIGEDVWMGANVFIAKGASIGNGVVVSAGSVVTGAVPDQAVVQGQPARVIRFRT
jgi:acetyltransferase-like isoleucine patch superfamily enzyme/acyl carrier protein